MNSNNRDRATAAMGENIGLVASAHIDSTFRQILRGPMVVAERRFVRLITGEAHSSGNFAIVSDPADPQGTQQAIEALRACGAPAAALFPGPLVPAVTDVLVGTGFEAYVAIPAMAVEIRSLPTTGLPVGYSLTRIGSGQESDAWTEAFAVGDGLPRGVAEVFSPNASTPPAQSTRRSNTSRSATVRGLSAHRLCALLTKSLALTASPRFQRSVGKVLAPTLPPSRCA